MAAGDQSFHWGIDTVPISMFPYLAEGHFDWTNGHSVRLLLQTAGEEWAVYYSTASTFSAWKLRQSMKMIRSEKGEGCG